MYLNEDTCTVFATVGVVHGPDRRRGGPAHPHPNRGRERRAPAGREAVLTEMRVMLESIRGVVDGLDRADMKQVAQAARASGTAAAADLAPELRDRLPLPFKELGMSVHRGFDDLATAADAGVSSREVLSRLSAQLASCVACHASYRLTAGTEG